MAKYRRIHALGKGIGRLIKKYIYLQKISTEWQLDSARHRGLRVTAPFALKLVLLRFGSFLILLLDFLYPDIAKAYVLSVFLKFEWLIAWVIFYATIGVFDRNVVVNLDPVPPKCQAGRVLEFFTLPLGGLENKMKRMPLTIGSPGVALGHMLHAYGTNAVRPDLPTVGGLDVFALGRLNLQFVTVLHINSAVRIAVGFSVASFT